VAALSMVAQGNQVNWDVTKEAGYIKTVNIGPRAWSIIGTCLEKLNTEQKLTLELLPLYSKFVEGS